MERPVGTIEMLQNSEDGALKVRRADPIIAISLELLADAAGAGALTIDQGELVFAGQVRYRPMEWSAFHEGLVCWKVSPESCRCTE